jgi:D-lyxose ketol-isomerase
VKRLQVERAVAAARAAFAAAGFRLPPFAEWTAADWAAHADSHAARAGLGWDVTDYGRGDFARCGLTLLTLRNGLAAELRAGRGFAYAEKLMLVGENQLAPMHRHRSKVEDIIVRGEGVLALELWPDADDRPARPARGRSARVLCDGVMRETGPDGVLRLRSGESVTLTPDVWHAFHGEGGPVVVGEVSSVNDDWEDNVFEDAIPRFSAIDEDAPATVALVSDRGRA